MSRPVHLPDATRFFARVRSGVLECPKCGEMLTFASGPSKNRRGSTSGWHSESSSLTCWNCQRTYVIGLIAWPVKRGGARTLPRDQVPNERQLAQLRAMGGSGAGWWMPQSEAKKPKRPDSTNITAGCSCREQSDGTPALDDPKCPVHGEDVEGVEGWQRRGDH